MACPFSGGLRERLRFSSEEGAIAFQLVKHTPVIPSKNQSLFPMIKRKAQLKSQSIGLPYHASVRERRQNADTLYGDRWKKKLQPLIAEEQTNFCRRPGRKNKLLQN
jgi:hypothetical protein